MSTKKTKFLDMLYTEPTSQRRRRQLVELRKRDTIIYTPTYSNDPDVHWLAQELAMASLGGKGI